MRVLKIRLQFFLACEPIEKYSFLGIWFDELFFECYGDKNAVDDLTALSNFAKMYYLNR